MPGLIGVITVGLILAGGAAQGQATEPFPDVPKTHWAYEAVTDLKAKGILIGYPPERPAAVRPVPDAGARRKPAPPVRRSRSRAKR